MSFKKILLSCALLTISNVFAQNTSGPSEVITGRYLGKTIPLRDAAIYNPENTGINELTIMPNAYEGSHENLVEGRSVNTNIQRNFGKLVTVGLDQNFDGASSNESGAIPPDPTGAVGPNHYVHSVNSVVKIFDKEGNLLSGPTLLGSFLGNGTNAGDPIVMYDQLADRFFVSQFGTAQNSLVLGISTTSDPTGTYDVYEYVFNGFPDYPHYSVWPDGYYLSVNEVGGGGPRSVYVMDREAMLAGAAAPQMAAFELSGLISNPTTVFNSGPAHLTGLQYPQDTPGFISYLQDDSWSPTITEDHMKVWEIDLDWDNINNATISDSQEIILDNFDSIFAQFGIGEINQPGTGQELAGQGGIISYASNYRSFDDHNSWLITFNIDVDGNDTSGIRWIELRNTAEDSEWTLYQEGTYAPDDGNSRFMSSGGIDERGNIAIAYSVGGSDTPVGLSYTGRFEGDALGELTIAETTIVEGVGIQTFSNRYGDYAHLTMDPIDDFTFWYTSQYFGQNNFWTTRIASFSLANEDDNDVGVVSINTPNDGLLTNSEVVEVEIRNFGALDQSNFDVVLMLDGVVQATETFTGTIASNELATFTFAQTLDLSMQLQTYEITAATALSNDSFTGNDAFSKNVLHTLANDIGVVEILTPGATAPIGDNIVTVVVRNFGGNTQSNFDVQYSVDGTSPVIENFSGPISTNEELSFNFTTEANLASFGTFVIEAKTNLSNDEDTINDTLTRTTQTVSCMPSATGGSGGIGCNLDGIKRFVLGDIDIDDGENGCNTEPFDSPNGYADRTGLSTVLSNLEGNNVYNLQAQTNFGAGVETLSAWIDFNDNFIFEPSEQLIAGEVFEVIQELDDFELIVPVGSTLGPHILRVKAIDGSANGDVNDPCSDYDFGETQDYTVIIDDVLGTEENQILDSDLIINSIDNKNFEITLNTQLDGNVFVAIYNPLGQQMKYKKVKRSGNSFNLSLNMEAVPSGVYFVKMIAVDHNSFKTAKIIVK